MFLRLGLCFGKLGNMWLVTLLGAVCYLLELVITVELQCNRGFLAAVFRAGSFVERSPLMLWKCDGAQLLRVANPNT